MQTKPSIGVSIPPPYGHSTDFWSYSDGAALNGTNQYTITFPKGKLPPVKGFWSSTLYNAIYKAPSVL
jgi:hypothetical protein